MQALHCPDVTPEGYTMAEIFLFETVRAPRECFGSDRVSIGSDRVSIGCPSGAIVYPSGVNRVSIGSGHACKGLISQGSGVSFSRFPSCMVRDGIVYASCALLGSGIRSGEIGN